MHTSPFEYVPARRERLACLPLNVVQSAAERTPAEEPEEVADEITGVVPPEEDRGYTAPTEVTVPLPPPRHVPAIEKQPAARLMPPVEEKVEVAVEKLMPLVLPMERIEPGVVVPMPTLPA